MLHSRLSHVCDACKARKVKCSKSSDLSATCMNCRKYKINCVHSPLKRKFKAHSQSSANPTLEHGSDASDDPVAPEMLTVEPSVSLPPDRNLSNTFSGRLDNLVHTPPLPGSVTNPTSYPLYVDQLLESQQLIGRSQNPFFPLIANENYLASSSMSFFSNSRLDVLSSRLGNDELKSLMSQISNMIKTRTEVHHHNLGPSSIWSPSDSAPTLSSDRTRHFVDVYFKYVHPLYPFLDRHDFESRAFSTKLDSDLANEASWAALYYSVLALGCEADGGGSFAPGKGEAWSLFRVALGLYPRVLLLNTELLEVQAITAMAVFCLNLSGSQIQGKITSEAARVAQRAFLNKPSTSSDAASRSRAFWVVYYIEKTISFQHGTNSFIVDCDIGVPVPFIEESFFDGLDWFLISIKFARLYSRVFTELFSISATKNSKESYLTKITDFEKLLDQQCQAIPSLFRPGLKLRPHAFSGPCGNVAALRIHYHFHELKIALRRLKLHVTRDQRYSQQWPALTQMMGSARAVIDLTRHIQQEPFTSLYILIYLPLTALFVLFDTVIHDPNSEDARINLVLLESVTGFFSTLEYVTDGYLPGSMLVQFASIAREFYKTHRISSSSNGESIDSGNVSTATSDIGTSTGAHLPWEANNDTSSFPLSGFIYPDGIDTVGLEVMDLFGGPMAGFELYQA